MQTYILDTQNWLTKAVIGLNLCPFAKAPWAKDQIRFTVSLADNVEALRDVLIAELQLLAATPIEEVETTLIIHPLILTDFFDYNDFLDVADEALQTLDLDGVIQVASFHPDYQFAGTSADAPENNTNRSPFPMLHLLREQSIEQALESGQDADAIVTRNIATMNQLGNAGWRALLSND
jgi:uncharacterized protein